MNNEHDGENIHLNGNRKEEHLEIGSTGYGLESVTSTTIEQKQNTKKNSNEI